MNPREDYLSVTEAANVMGKGRNLVGKLCRAGRFSGAVQIGTTWIIPREAVLNYTPGKRGVKPGTPSKKAKLAAERAAILEKARENEAP